MYNAKDGRKKGEGEGVKARTPALAGVFIGKCMVPFLLPKVSSPVRRRRENNLPHHRDAARVDFVGIALQNVVIGF